MTRLKKRVDASPLFRAAGISKDVKVDMPDHAIDNDLVGKIKRGWAYGAFLAFREYRKRYGKPSSFATIGTGVGIDAIGACEILQPEKLIITDIHPEIPSLAKQNLKNNGSCADAIALTGDLCHPLVENNLQVDLLYANLPNVPSEEPVLVGRRSATYFQGKIHCPDVFEHHLLSHQYSFLRQAKSALEKGGAVISAIGGRLPYEILTDLFAKAGYAMQELVSTFKYQTEPEDVLSGYAKAEKQYGTEFDFYHYPEAQEKWLQFGAARLTGAEIKEDLRQHRVSATEAWGLYRTGKQRSFGIVAHYLCGREKAKAFSIPDCIGNTPLIELNYPEFVCPVCIKLESLNPGGSMKDRVALHMIREAEKQGFLKPGGTIIEASSGNQGAAIAMIGAACGYKVIITASEKISKEKLDVLKAYGADVRICKITPTLEHPDSYYTLAKKLAEEIQGAHWLNQYHSPLNPEAHYLTTGPEIWKQTEGRLTHFFAAAGSTGTICGVGKFLKEKSSDVKIIAIDAATSFFSSQTPKPYKTEGLGIDYRPEFLDESVIDEVITATDEQAFSNARRLAREKGLLVGGSSGAVLHALFVYAPRFKPDDFVVVLFADSGRNYLSKIFCE